MLNRPLTMPSGPAAFLAAFVLAGLSGATPSPEPSTPPPSSARPAPNPASLTILERSITQHQGSWQVDYKLRHDGKTGVVVTPTEINARVEGWVSNSRVLSHAVPRPSSIVVSGASGLSASADVITSADESQRCRERAVLRVWTDDMAANTAPAASDAGDRAPILSLAPGAIFRVRVRLEHQHFLYGDYDPLLGHRSVEVQLGNTVLRDALPIDREQCLAQPKFTWPPIPDDRRDTRQFVSGPDSLHLEAHIPGNQYFRFPERPVRYSTKMRLRFWYLVAPGTEGECRVRIAQYKDTPTAWKVLSEGGFDYTLPAVGRWVKYERIFRTEPDATTVALDFRICSGTDVGEMWIDDVCLEPVGAVAENP